MRDLTLHEMDEQLAEQLPARELMGGCCRRPAPTYSHNQAAWSGGNGNGFGNGNHNGNGNGNGIGNGSSVNVSVEL